MKNHANKNDTKNDDGTTKRDLSDVAIASRLEDWALDLPEEDKAMQGTMFEAVDALRFSK